MKAHIHLLVLAIAVSIACYSQELPESNRKILEYAKSKMWQRVGGGICFNLIDSALCQINPMWKQAGRNNFKYGKKISKKKIISGDILLDKAGRGHVAIVYEVISNKSISVINQNVGGSGVVVSHYNWEWEKENGSNISFYRPQ